MLISETANGVNLASFLYAIATGCSLPTRLDNGRKDMAKILAMYTEWGEHFETKDKIFAAESFKKLEKTVKRLEEMNEFPKCLNPRAILDAIHFSCDASKLSDQVRSLSQEVHARRTILNLAGLIEEDDENTDADQANDATPRFSGSQSDVQRRAITDISHQLRSSEEIEMDVLSSPSTALP